MLSSPKQLKCEVHELQSDQLLYESQIYSLLFLIHLPIPKHLPLFSLLLYILVIFITYIKCKWEDYERRFFQQRMEDD